MTPLEKLEMLDSHASRIAEHFDSVQILVTITEDDAGTAFYSAGKGDWYARRGACTEWIERDQADTNGRALAQEINKNDDD